MIPCVFERVPEITVQRSLLRYLNIFEILQEIFQFTYLILSNALDVKTI